jgi:integrase
MAVYDRWHKSRPAPGDSLCREHKMIPAAGHGEGERWQVRWRDESGAQRKRNFARKTGPDPEKSADAFDAKVRTSLDDGSYMDPSSASVTFRAFAEDWRKTRTHDVQTAARIERQLRLHVYPVLGDRTLRELGKRPSIIQAWISGLSMAPSSAGQVIRDVSSVFAAAADDGLVARNPVQARSVTRPKVPERKARPWTLAQVEAVSATLGGRHAVLPYFGAGTGMRQGEMFGLAVDDIDFLRHVIHVRRQVRLLDDGTMCYSPVKNGKAHDVPLSESLAPVLAEHIRKYPPLPVTLPWQVRDGKPVTHVLLLTDSKGGALYRPRVNEAWRSALAKAGIVPARKAGERPEPGNGMHVLRHTAASAWLAAGVDIVSVAAWLGDIVATVLATYAHLMPDADDRGRKAMDLFFSAPSARDVPAEGRR